MSAQVLDLRSDTLTRPTQPMRAAMAKAEVGDDVFGEDPTINRLQERIAETLGKEAALFVPSGTMSNLIGIRVHCGPGDEFICEADCHIFNFEQSGYAQLGGVAARPIEGEFGILYPEQLENKIRGSNDHLVQTKLISLENTHNRGAGRIQPYETVKDICRWAHENGLATHLDGARLFNAVVASGISAADWASHFDTVSVCFSKGLGAPVGSALAGPRGLVQHARRLRKVLGGGTRQGGVIAAGALYALEHHVERLSEDHANAALLAEAIRQCDGLDLFPESVDTNIVIFRVDPSLGTAAEFAKRLQQDGLRVLPVAKDLIRAVTHLDVTREDTLQAGDILRSATVTVS